MPGACQPRRQSGPGTGGQGGPSSPGAQQPGPASLPPVTPITPPGTNPQLTWIPNTEPKKGGERGEKTPICSLSDGTRFFTQCLNPALLFPFPLSSRGDAV